MRKLAVGAALAAGLAPTTGTDDDFGPAATDTPVVIQHLFVGGDGLSTKNRNGTSFEASGIVTLRGTVLAFAAMSCPGTAKHSSTICGHPLSSLGTGAVALRRSTDSAKTWGTLIFVNTTVTSQQRDVLAGPVPVADEETGNLFVSWARKQSPPHGQTQRQRQRRGEGGGLGFLDAWVAKSTDLGLTWSTPQNITPPDLQHHHVGLGSYGHGVQIRDGPHKGRLLVQYYGDVGGERAWLYYSDTSGESWEVTGVVSGSGPTVRQLCVLA